MKVVLPFWKLEIIDRYHPQFNALAREITELVIIYTTGVPPEDMEKNITFLKVKLPKYGHKYLNWWMGRKEIPKIIPVDVDAVYSLSGLWMNIYGQEIADHLGIPHIIRMRGSMTETRKYNGKGRAQNWIFGRAHEKCFKKASLITSIVNKYVPYLRDIGLDETQIGEVIPNGIDFKATQKGPDQFTPGYAGRISKEKGSAFLLELIKNTPEITWKITGEIQDQDFIPPDNCDYLGKTPFPEMPLYYDQVSLLVQPSFTEGFPNVILEAFMLGKMVIGSIDAYPEEVMIFGARIPLDIDLWVSMITRYSEMPLDHFIDEGNNAKEYARLFTWKNHGSRIAGQIRKAISMKAAITT